MTTNRQFIDRVVLTFYRAEASAYDGEPPSIYDLLEPFDDASRLKIKGDRENLGDALSALSAEEGPGDAAMAFDEAYAILEEIISRRGRPTVAAMAFTEIS